MFKGLIGALRVDLGMDSAQFVRGSDKAIGTAQKMRAKMGAIGAGMRNTGAVMSVAATAPLIAFAKKSMDAAAVQEKAVAAMEAALTSMGGTAGFTSEQLQAMASDLQNKSLFGDEDILQKVTANLLTFGNVSGEAFGRAQQAAVDLSARLGQDLQSSTVMLGKALNDPVAGITALSRVGVSFTEQQKDQIKAMAEVGDVAGAQSLILDELNKQYSGQAEALRNLPAGQIQAATMAIGDAMEKVGSIILPVIADIAVHIEKMAVKFQNLSPDVQKFVVIGGALAAALGPAAVAMGAVVAGLGALISPIGLVVVGLAGLTAGVVYAVRNWDELKERFPVVQGVADGVRLAFEALAPVFGFVSDQFSILVDGVSALVNGDWTAAWDSFKTVVSNIVSAVGTIYLDLGKFALEAMISVGKVMADKMADLAADMKEWAGDVIAGFVQGFKDKIASAKGAVTDFGDNVSGWFKDKLGIRSPSRVFKGFGVNVVEGLAVGIDKAAPLAERAIVSLSERVSGIAKSTMQNVIGSFSDGIAAGDMRGAFSGAVSDYMAGARESFSGILSDALSGGGFAAIGTSLKNAWAGVKGALSGGLSFGGIGSALGAALPIVGAVSSLIGLIKGFSSKTLLDSGLKINLSGGDLDGGTFETWKKTSFWGLFSSTKTKLKAFDVQTSSALMDQVDAVRDAVAKTYDAAGVAIEAGFVDGFSYDFGKISTKGLSEAEIKDLVQDAFVGYGDAISHAIGGVSLDVARIFAESKAILEPSGQAFFGVFSDMANAANDLASSFGGVDALASGVSGFVSTFFTQAEQMDMVSDQVEGVFDRIGLAVPKTLKAFRELVLSQDLMTASGRDTYQALLSVAGGFASINAGLGQSFDMSGGWYASEFEARLDQAARARGFSTVTQIAQTSGTTQVGRTSLGGDDGAAVQLLQTLVGIFKDWDDDGQPPERIF